DEPFPNRQMPCNGLIGGDEDHTWEELTLQRPDCGWPPTRVRCNNRSQVSGESIRERLCWCRPTQAGQPPHQHIVRRIQCCGRFAAEDAPFCSDYVVEALVPHPCRAVGPGTFPTARLSLSGKMLTYSSSIVSPQSGQVLSSGHS